MAERLLDRVRALVPGPEMILEPAYVFGPALFASGSGGKPTVRVTRRRRPTTPAGGRERAQVPKRDRPSSSGGSSSGVGGGGAGSGSTGGGGGGLLGGGGSLLGGGGTGGSLPGLGGKLSLPIIAVLLVMVLIGLFICRGCGGGGGSSDLGAVATLASSGQVAGVATSTPFTIATPRPTTSPIAAATAAPGEKWLVMLYQDADDKVLEQDIYLDLNEAERAGSSDAVQIVAQIDRYQGSFSGDGNWTSAKRFYVTRDDDLNTVRSQELADLGEVNMSDGQTLVDFVTWAMAAYPADKYALILSDHGMGWPGGWSDPTASGTGGASVPLAQRLGDQLFLDELDGALTTIRQQTGLDKFELIGMDACLMGHLEVFSALQPHARYAVASQETEPAVGWAYASFLRNLQQNPNVGGAELGRYIVESYIDEDQRVVDDQARLEFVGGGRGLFGSVPSADALASRLSANVTLAAVDLSALAPVMEGLNELAFQMQQAGQKQVAQARSYAQSFTSIFGNQVPPSYIDLGNFAQLVTQGAQDQRTVAAADNLLAAVNRAVIAERHGPDKPGSTGISIYFPNSQLYTNPVSGYQSYLGLASRFAQESLWDEFLNYHYTGRGFDASSQNVSEPAQEVQSPASGGIQVSAINASAKTVAPGETVLLSADITGENIGYVKLLAGYFDQAANSMYVADQDYLESSETTVLNGVYYPVWPDTSFTMEFEWEPIVFAIDDGEQRVPALFKPLTYGGSYDQAVYTVDGIYTHLEDGQSQSAQLHFRNGTLEHVYTFTGDETAGAPREILPDAGDKFTVLEQWLDFAEAGGEATPATENGQTITFSDRPFTWVDMDAAAGNYVVGFLVEDLDGKQYPVYTQITVE